MKIKFLSLLLVVVLVAGFAAGCASEPASTNQPSTAAPSTDTAQTPDSNDEPDADPEGVIYPLASPVTLTAWWPTNHVDITDPNKTLPFIEGTKRTNIHWEFQVPSNGSESEQFNLLIASMEYPDLIKNFGSYYTKGLDFAIEDEIIFDMLNYIDYMPDIARWRSSTPLMMRSLTTDGGHFAGIPLFLIGSADHLAQGAYSGYAIRTDWLDNLGLAIPETYDEMETVLAAMQQYCDNPFELWPNADTYALMGGYNIVSVASSLFGSAGGWVVKDGTVEYTLFDENYHAYVTMLNDWVNKGFIANDYYTETTGWNNALTKASNNKLGVFNCMYTWYELFLSTSLDESFDMTAIPVLRQSKSDRVHVRSARSGASIAACVTTQCENPEYVAMYWNYFFTDEGIILGNYGVEGDTFYYDEAGKPHYTQKYWDMVAEKDSSWAQGMLLTYLGPGFRWWDREMDGLNETAVSFLAIWDSNDFTDSEMFYPADATMTGEENTTYATVMSDISTYVSENLTAFIIGTKPMTEWDEFIGQIKGMGIDQLQQIKQAAYDRYANR